MTQADFSAALLDADIAPAALHDGQGRPAGRRFDIYRNNVAVGLTEALEIAFPVIRQLVGDTFFRAMAGVHLRAHPPRGPVMMFYGADFPAFLASFPPVAHLPYLRDVARLELALRESYHAADSAPLPAEQLAAVGAADLPALRLVFAPAVRLVRSTWPVAAIWTAHHGGPAPAMRPEAALVTRPGLDPAVHALDEATGLAVAALMQGQPLGAVIAGGTFDAGALLGLLLREGALEALQ